MRAEEGYLLMVILSGRIVKSYAAVTGIKVPYPAQINSRTGTSGGVLRIEAYNLGCFAKAVSMKVISEKAVMERLFDASLALPTERVYI